MGFLDRMVGNLVADATGVDRRLVRNLVGNKSLLMLGAGAALGGGAMAGLSGKQQPSTGPSTWDNPAHIEGATGTATPPPPPPRSQGTTPPKPPGERTAPPPPPPPPPGSVPPAEDADEAGEDGLREDVAPDADAVEKTAEELEEPLEEQLPQELTYGLVRAMVAAALADGDLTEKEREMIHDQLDDSGDDSGLTDRQVKQVQRDLVLPPSVGDLAELAGEEEGWKEAMYRFAGFVILADEEVADLERSWLDRLAGAFGFTDELKDALEEEIFAAG